MACVLAITTQLLCLVLVTLPHSPLLFFPKIVPLSRYSKTESNKITVQATFSLPKHRFMYAVFLGFTQHSEHHTQWTNIDKRSRTLEIRGKYFQGGRYGNAWNSG